MVWRLAIPVLLALVLVLLVLLVLLLQQHLIHHVDYPSVVLFLVHLMLS